ncbi:hypothetical protein [Oribacterium sp. Sow4_G1_1]|uniref:hypothetical protein n=1 Tax=Oribacterium sp. Sow4_G1_1 TaxID=3438794 RepID=UPI003F9A20C1
MGKIRINAKTLIYIIILFTLNIQWMRDFLGLPLAIPNLHIILLTILILLDLSKVIDYIRQNNFWKLLFAFIVGSHIIGWIINLNADPILIVWTFYKTYAYFLFFIVCVIELNVTDVKKIFVIMLACQILNVGFSAYEHSALGLQSDYLGGIFGIRQGGNGFTNIFGVVLINYLITLYIYNKQFLWLFFCIITFLVIAAQADIIGLIILIAISLIITVISMRLSFKKCILIAAGIVGILVAQKVFASMYPERFVYFQNIERLLKYIGGGSNSDGGIYGISRINPFAQINRLYFNDNVGKYLFGYGFGNASYSDGVKLFQSEFYLRNAYFPYYWFSTAYVYLETGITGLGIYLAVALHCLSSSLKYIKVKELKHWGVYELILTIAYVFSFFYNQSITQSSAYLIYFGLAVPYIFNKDIKHLPNLYLKRVNYIKG